MAAPPPSPSHPAHPTHMPRPVVRPGAMALPVVSPQRCTGCGWCVGVCAPHVLSLSTPSPGARKQSVLHDASGCTGCALCALRCPFNAIEMVRKSRP